MIKLENFILEKIDIRNPKHINLIKQFDNDALVKKYLYPYKESFYDMVLDNDMSDFLFNSFYIINYQDRIVGYVEIKNIKDVDINYALLKSERNRGIATLFLKELSSYLLKECQDQIMSVNTIIRKENIPSINASKKAMFKLYKEDSKFETYRKTKCN